MNLNFMESVRNAPRVKLILEPPRAAVIEACAGSSVGAIFHEHLSLACDAPYPFLSDCR
jgi:hypothetical protein